MRLRASLSIAGLTAELPLSSEPIEINAVTVNPSKRQLPVVEFDYMRAPFHGKKSIKALLAKKFHYVVVVVEGKPVHIQHAKKTFRYMKGKAKSDAMSRTVILYVGKVLDREGFEKSYSESLLGWIK